MNTINSAPRRHNINGSPVMMSRESINNSNHKSTKSAYRSQIEIPGKKDDYKAQEVTLPYGNNINNQKKTLGMRHNRSSVPALPHHK